MGKLFVGGERQELSIVLENALGTVIDPATEDTLLDVLVFVDSINDLLTEIRGLIPDETGTYKLYTGVSGTADILAGERIVGIHCVAGALDATIAVGALAVVTVPATRSFSLSPKGNVVGTDVVFTNTSSYVVEVLS